MGDYVNFGLQGGELIHKFLPLLMSLVVESSLSSLDVKHKDSTENAENGDNDSMDQFSGYFEQITTVNSVAFTLAWCYLLHVIKQKDRYSEDFSANNRNDQHFRPIE